MAGIVTILEGLLPSLPPAVILQQLVRTFVHRGAIRPRLHRACATHGRHMQHSSVHTGHACSCPAAQVGPAELPDGGGTRPTELLQLLLAPDVHRHASSQLRNRVAGLLLQVTQENTSPEYSWGLPSATSHVTQHPKSHHMLQGLTHMYAGVQGGWRAAGISGWAAATAAAHLPLPCRAACRIRQCVQHRQSQRQHRRRARQLQWHRSGGGRAFRQRLLVRLAQWLKH
jgi:hypothetical protein